MGKPAVLYTAPRRKTPLDIHQIAALAGCSPSAAYDRINLGHPVAGHVWAKAGTRPAAPTSPHGRPLVTDAFPGQTFTHAQVRAMGNLGPRTSLQPYVRNGFKVGGHVWRFADGDAPAPERTQFGAKLRKEIVCWCEDCRGRRWTLDEIRACPGFPAGLVINGMTLRRVGQAVGHPLQYPRADGTTAGAWRKNGATPAAPAAPASPEPRGAWRFGTSPEAYDLFPTRERAPVLDSGAIGGRGEM